MFWCIFTVIIERPCGEYPAVLNFQMLGHLPSRKKNKPNIHLFIDLK